MALILVPTPVGNREDITARALAVLASADVVACERSEERRVGTEC